jgi:hypothetical protein
MLGPTEKAPRFARLESWARELIPALGRITHRWSGQVLDTIDYAGFIGRELGSERIYLAMGDSGQGLTHGVMGAMLNTALILGEDHPWKSVYAPDRKPLAAAKNFLRENMTILQNLAEYVAPGEIASLEELELGEGAILGGDSKRSPPTRTRPANCIFIRPAAPISAVICTGTALRAAGTVRVTVRSLPPTGSQSMLRPCRLCVR